ncbi:O-antigen ligase family protein [Microbacterium sp. SA39]|uniref:O-antigen ligase family protein n=1 Tax=Microbacterium sp. SA39 TaxID=1263625 RepID=UPI0005F9D001|nr:O-antigen ligase family protein [Microbacterium sp. SA39]KJQ55082.1 O-Antigen ligase [Microbacterium sp. SA39]
MKFTAVAPLTAFGRVSRSILIVALLLGSLFPLVEGFPVAVVAAAAAGIVIVYEIFRWLPQFHPVIVVPVFFGLVALHSQYIAPATEYGDDKLQKWVTITLISAMAASLLRDRRAFQTFGAVWLVATSLLAVATIAGFDGGRADAFGANPIWLARALATGILIAIWLWWKKYASAWAMLLVVALLGAGLAASGSRGPAIGAVAGVVVLALFAGRGRLWRVALILAGGVAAVWAVQVLPFFAGSRFDTLLTGGGNADDTVRTTYWSLTRELISTTPDGVGFGNWNAAVGYPRHLWPHNLFLEVGAEMGIWLGLLTVAIVVVVALRLLRRSTKDPIALLVLALLTAEIVSVNLSGDLNARTFWFMLTLGFLVTTRFVLDAPMKAKRHLRKKQERQAAENPPELVAS